MTAWNWFMLAVDICAGAYAAILFFLGDELSAILNFCEDGNEDR